MAGLSGSGKSTTAGALASQVGAIRLRSDAVRKHLAGVPLHEKAPHEIYSSAMSDKTYTRLIQLGVQLAIRGYRVILDAKFDRQKKRREAVTTAQSNDIMLTFLHCIAPKDVLKVRLNHRSGDIADADIAILAQQFMEPFAAETTVMTVDTTQSAMDIQRQLASLFE